MVFGLEALGEAAGAVFAGAAALAVGFAGVGWGGQWGLSMSGGD